MIHGSGGIGTRVFWWYCPLCTIDGTLDVDPRCLHCHGSGLTDDVTGWEDVARWAPLPPTTPERPCPDCATRTGSPEDEGGELHATILNRERPFMCHQGMPMIDGSYQPTMSADGIPLGARPCRGWVDWCRTGQLPEEPYRQMPENDIELRN